MHGVIFDLDGTLVNTLEDIAGAANAVLAQAGWPAHETAAYRAFVGNGVVRLLERAAPGVRGEGLAELVASYRRAYAARGHRSSVLYPGVVEVLSALRARGLLCAVHTNKPQEWAEALLDNLCIRGKFAMVLGAEAGFADKPDPAGALHIAASLGLTSREMFFVGDSSTDMETARAAAMCAVGVSWGFRAAEELYASGAHRVVATPEGLLEFLRVSENCG